MPSDSKPKKFVLDTNVLMHDPQSIFVLAGKDNHVIIPIIVLTELDGLKRDPAARAAAGEAVRTLEMFSASGEIYREVVLESGGKVTIDVDGKAGKALPFGMDPKKPDNIIAATALRYQSVAHGRYATVLVTKDINLRTIARALGLNAEDYMTDKVVHVDQLYTGLRELVVPDEAVALFYPQGSKDNDEIIVPAASILRHDEKTLPNSCWRLRGEGRNKTILAIYKHQDQSFHFVPKPPKNPHRGVQPRNEEQSFLYALGMDHSISIITAAGPAGTGKSIMSLLAACKLIIDKKPETCREFHRKVIEDEDAERLGRCSANRIQIYTPTRELGPELGFLPGDLSEKIDPWKRPTLSNLRLIIDDDARLGDLLRNGTIEILPITHIRGDTVNRAFMIVRDAQNFTPSEMKAIVTRVGEGTKLIIEGDLDQVDVPNLDGPSSGLAHVISKFPGQEIYGHIKLVKGERSVVATLASTLL